MRLNPSSWQIFVAQVQAATPIAATKKRVSTPNPRPAGVIRHGSATHAVLQLLRDNPAKKYSCFGLCRDTGNTIKAVNHACLYLRRMKIVDTYGDPRSTSYLTYSISRTGNVTAKVSQAPQVQSVDTSSTAPALTSYDVAAPLP